MAVALGIPHNAPGLSRTPASRSARPRSARSTWPTPTRPSPTAASATTGSWSRRSPAPRRRGALPRAEARPTGCSPRTSPATRQLRDAAGGPERHRHQRAALGRPAAGKTGTATNDDGDVSSSWFVGYTPQVATAVMYVRGKGNEALNGFLPSFFGGDYPARTWAALMRPLMEGPEVEDFPRAGLLVDGEAPDAATRRTRPPPEPTDDQPEPEPRSPKPTPTPADPDPAGRRRPARADPGATPDPGRGGDDGGATRPAPGESLRPDGPEPAARDPDPGAASRRPVARPTREDPVARSLSEVVGGPVGRHARPHRWWTPVRVLLALFAVRRSCSRWCSTRRACRRTGPATRPATARCATPTSPTSTPAAGSPRAVAVRRQRRPLPGDGVPRRHRLLRLRCRPVTQLSPAGRRPAERRAGDPRRGRGRCPGWPRRSTPTSW